MLVYILSKIIFPWFFVTTTFILIDIKLFKEKYPLWRIVFQYGFVLAFLVLFHLICWFVVGGLPV